MRIYLRLISIVGAQTLGSVTGLGSITAYSAYTGAVDQTLSIFNSYQDGINVTSYMLNAQSLDSPTTGTDLGGSSPSTLKNLTDYAQISATADNMFFGIVDGTIQQYIIGPDPESWTYVGTVPTK